MQPHCRRAVAFIAASLQSADSSPLLVDLTANEVFSFAGELSARRVVITNNRDGTYFTGADESMPHSSAPVKYVPSRLLVITTRLAESSPANEKTSFAVKSTSSGLESALCRLAAMKATARRQWGCIHSLRVRR